MITKYQLLQIMPLAAKLADAFTSPLNRAMLEFEINTQGREAAFLAQLAHESSQLRGLVENMNYSDPLRIAQIFRSKFDLDQDRVIDPAEIEFAKQYVHQPEKLANRAYANMIGNGDESSGDGWNYRARGPIGITGKDNYAACGKALGIDLIAHPELLEQPLNGCRSAGNFWRSNGLNELADQGLFRAITKRINKGLVGIQEREAYYARAKVALNVQA